MVKYEEPHLDLVFAALSDATRRRVLAQLGQGRCTVTELAEQHEMSLPGFMKHLAVLETAGLIARTKEGRVVHCELNAAPMQEAAMWISRYEQFWTDQLDALGRFLYHQEELSTWTPSNVDNTPPKSPSGASTPSRRKKSGTPGPTRKR